MFLKPLFRPIKVLGGGHKKAAVAVEKFPKSEVSRPNTKVIEDNGANQRAQNASKNG